jgi:hypothetical protein
VGPRAGLDVCEKSRFHPDSIPGPERKVVISFNDVHPVVSGQQHKYTIESRCQSITVILW